MLDGDLALVDRLEPRGHRPDLPVDVAAGVQDGATHDHGRAAGRGLLVVRHDRRVAHHDGDPSTGAPSSSASDLGEDRPRPLAHVRRAGVDDGAAVRQEPDRGIGETGRRAGLEPDGDAAAATGRRRGPPSDELGRPLQRLAPSPSAGVSPGMNASPGRARFRSRSSSGSMPSARAASSMFDSTAQICCGLPKPRNAVEGTVCDRTLRAKIRTAGTAVRPVRAEAALADRPIGDVGVGADQVVRAMSRNTIVPSAGSRSGHGRSTRPGGRPGTSPRASARAGRDVRCGARGRPPAARTWRAACRRTPPPGSGAKTRTFASGMPSTPATTRWSQYGCWIELQMAIPSPSGAAMNACGSIANWVTIGKL